MRAIRKSITYEILESEHITHAIDAEIKTEHYEGWRFVKSSGVFINDIFYMPTITIDYELTNKG